MMYRFKIHVQFFFTTKHKSKENYPACDCVLYEFIFGKKVMLNIHCGDWSYTLCMHVFRKDETMNKGK